VDNLKDLGNKLKQGFRESSQNIRRFSENYPMLERTVDKVGPANPYQANFRTTDHPHTVKLDFIVEEFNEECVVQPVEQAAIMQTRCPQYPFANLTSDGGYYQETGVTSIEINIGGFSYDNGIVIPFAGIYQVHYTNNVVGVALSPTCVRASIRHNGAIIAEQIRCNSCGFCFFSVAFSMAATIVAAPGDIISTWQQAQPELFHYTPSNFCSLEDSLGARGYVRVELVGEA
jgi:hypothetical protein